MFSNSRLALDMGEGAEEVSVLVSRSDKLSLLREFSSASAEFGSRPATIFTAV